MNKNLSALLMLIHLKNLLILLQLRDQPLLFRVVPNRIMNHISNGNL